MFCSYCGNKLLDDARFCSYCGKGVVNVTKAQQPIQPPADPPYAEEASAVQSAVQAVETAASAETLSENYFGQPEEVGALSEQTAYAEPTVEQASEQAEESYAEQPVSADITADVHEFPEQSAASDDSSALAGELEAGVLQPGFTEPRPEITPAQTEAFEQPAAFIPQPQVIQRTGYTVAQIPMPEQRENFSEPKRLPERKYTLAHLMMCLASTAVFAIAAGVFAGLYFSTV